MGGRHTRDGWTEGKAIVKQKTTRNFTEFLHPKTVGTIGVSHTEQTGDKSWTKPSFQQRSDRKVKK